MTRLPQQVKTGTRRSSFLNKGGACRRPSAAGQERVWTRTSTRMLVCLVGCWPLATGCWLLAASCWLLAVGCWCCWCCWLRLQEAVPHAPRMKRGQPEARERGLRGHNSPCGATPKHGRSPGRAVEGMRQNTAEKLHAAGAWVAVVDATSTGRVAEGTEAKTARVPAWRKATESRRKKGNPLDSRHRRAS